MIHGASVTEAVVKSRRHRGQIVDIVKSHSKVRQARMDLGKGLGHLTYSTLVHQTDDWDQLWKSVNTYLPAVKARFAPNAEVRRLPPHLGARRPKCCRRTRRSGDDLKQFFKDQDLYLYTANAFVYGVFKKQVIKEDVYEPDWLTPERREYTKQVANLLAELAPEGVNPSIQSAPLGFKPKVTGPDIVDGVHGRTSSTSSRTWWSSRRRPARLSDAGARAGAALLSRDDRRDDHLLPGATCSRRRRRSSWRRRPASMRRTRPRR